jgi:hypothetical protein
MGAQGCHSPIAKVGDLTTIENSLDTTPYVCYGKARALPTELPLPVRADKKCGDHQKSAKRAGMLQPTYTLYGTPHGRGLRLERPHFRIESYDGFPLSHCH